MSNMKSEFSTRTVLFWLTWHVLMCTGLTSLVALRRGVFPWQLSGSQLQVAALISAGYLIAVTLLHIRWWLGRRVDLLEIGASVLAGYGSVLLYLVVVDAQYSRLVLLAAVTGTLLILGAIVLLWRFRAALLALLTVTVAGGLLLTQRPDVLLQASSGGRSIDTRVIDSSLYSIRGTVYRNFIPPSESFHAGGAITSVGDRYLVVNADGDLYSLNWPSETNGSPTVNQLDREVPLNRSSFLDAAGQGDYTNYFRVLDLLVDSRGDSLRIIASHHHWDEEEECFVVRLSMAAGPSDRDLEGVLDGGWRSIHDTEPCLPLRTSASPSWPYRGMEGGGKMAMLGDGEILLTVGDQGFNGFRFEPNYVQDTDASYGKTVTVDLTDGSWESFTVGHRNPQGLFVDSTGAWLSEHGPQGGDELNRLVRGENYGWPIVTTGTDYGDNAWPNNPAQGRHEGYAKPIFSWVPAIAPSALTRSSGKLFSFWEGDLLLASLKAETLFRIRLVDGRVEYIEPIEVGQRIRDVTQDETGRIVLWTDSYDLIVLEPISHAFARCSGCHTVEDGTSHGLGPDLAGVLGREIASKPGFDYSEGLQSVEGRWTKTRLKAYMEDPDSFAPGTSMQMTGIDDPQTRDAIVEYLRQR